jgi:hypothetical protein
MNKFSKIKKAAKALDKLPIPIENREFHIGDVVFQTDEKGKLKQPSEFKHCAFCGSDEHNAPQCKQPSERDDRLKYKEKDTPSCNCSRTLEQEGQEILVGLYG